MSDVAPVTLYGERMPETPEELRPVLRDVHAASPVRVVVREPSGDHPYDAGTVWLHVAGTLGSIGFRPAPGTALPDRVCAAADQLHDWILECLPELGFPAVWPECPEHPATHPLRVGMTGDGPVWRCPRSAAVHARVGELGRVPFREAG